MVNPVIFVCSACAFSKTQREYQGQRGGAHLIAALRQTQSQQPQLAPYKIEPVGCLNACNRACTIAFSSPQKNTLMFGDLPPLESASAIFQLAAQYHSSPDGIVPRQQRPSILQRGILSSNSTLFWPLMPAEPHPAIQRTGPKLISEKAC